MSQHFIVQEPRNEMTDQNSSINYICTKCDKKWYNVLDQGYLIDLNGCLN